MIVIKLTGGLGNQMFQFAFGLAFLEAKRKVKLDISFYQSPHINRSFELLKVFKNILIPIAGLRDVFYFLERRLNANGEVIYQIKEGRHIIKEDKENEFTYQASLRNLEEVYFQGYWQDTAYFKDYRKELLHYFKFPEIPENNLLNNVAAQQILSSNSIAVHIRRTDYLHNNFYKKVDENYYLQAFHQINRKVRKPHFFIFSDDMIWAKRLMNDWDHAISFIEQNSKENSFRDMQLMSLCKHYIIANSTFSWWAAWLNNHENKIVITPKEWFNKPICMDGLLLKEWIKM